MNQKKSTKLIKFLIKFSLPKLAMTNDAEKLQKEAAGIFNSNLNY